MQSRDPSCLRCAALEREVLRLRIDARQLLDDLEEERSDNRSLRRAVARQRRALDELEDRLAEHEPREEADHEDPAP